jgi:ABC-type nitrate/sulfonate/bicarbonate transport system substrate-binding protein
MQRAQAIRTASGSLALLAGVPLRARASETLRIATLTIDSGAACFYADDQGFFRRAGIEAQIQTLASGGAIVAAVASNSVDVGFANLVSVVAAFAKNVPIAIVAPGSVDVEATPTNALVVVPGSSIRTGRDFNGKTMATTTLRNIVQFAAQAWIDANGGDSTTVRFVEMPFSEMTEALVANRIDAAILAEPFMSVAKPRTRFIAYPMAAIGSRVQLGGWIAPLAWARAHPALVAAFADAIVKTNAWANAHHDVTARLLVKYGKLDPELVAHMNRATYTTALVPAEMQPAIDVAARYGAIAQSIPAQSLIFRASDALVPTRSPKP